MTFPKPEEDKVVLNIVWGYFAKLITKEQMIDLLNRIDHSFKHLFDSKEIIKVNPNSVTKSDNSGTQSLEEKPITSIQMANDTKTPDTHSQIKKEILKDYALEKKSEQGENDE